LSLREPAADAMTRGEVRSDTSDLAITTLD
jgi:hypothetical protein